MQKNFLKKVTGNTAYGSSSESGQRELSNEHRYVRVKRVFKNICVVVLWMKVASASLEGLTINHSNAEASFVQRTRTQIFLKNIQTLSCWYSLDSSR